MRIESKEHYEILDMFEKQYSHLRLDRVDDMEWKKKGYIYESGETNELYKAFMSGYSLGRLNYMN